MALSNGYILDRYLYLSLSNRIITKMNYALKLLFQRSYIWYLYGYIDAGKLFENLLYPYVLGKLNLYTK